MSVREAAERLNRYIEDRTVTAADYEDCEGDIQYVANAYLAEHPADEDEPIDEDWLRSIGFHVNTGDDYYLWINSPNQDFDIQYWDDWEEFRFATSKSDYDVPVSIKTRGQLRDLLKALGLETKGGAK